jgi:DNA-binding CsgD family transcriptional regulator
MWMAYLREHGPKRDAIFFALQNVSGRVLTRTRSAIISDAVWYRSADFNDYRKPAGFDHSLVSVCEVSDQGAIAAILLARGLRERDFSPGEVRLLEFFHRELGPLIGRQLVSATEPSPEQLSPRLRQTLACLVEGDSEKQVAARLGLSPTTVHEYVTALYRRFGVHSRGELLAHVLKRSGRREWSRT